MEYFTVSSQYSPTLGSDCHSITIGKASSEEEALLAFQHHYGEKAKANSKVIKGIHIENGFNDLLTDQCKKILIKIIAKDKNAPDNFYYTNSILTKYEE